MKEESRDPEELYFHYDREERMAGLPSHVGRKSGKGIFRRNRSLLITLIDVVFLVILVVVFSVVIRLRGDTSLVPGYTVTARAVAFEERVLVSVKVVARTDDANDERLRMQIAYKESPTRVEIDGYLPNGRGAEQVYRGALDLKPSEDKIVIRFFTADTQNSTSVKIKKE